MCIFEHSFFFSIASPHSGRRGLSVQGQASDLSLVSRPWFWPILLHMDLLRMSMGRSFCDGHNQAPSPQCGKVGVVGRAERQEPQSWDLLPPEGSD